MKRLCLLCLMVLAFVVRTEAITVKDTVALLCMPQICNDVAYPLDSLKATLGIHNIRCVEISIDNSGSKSLKQITKEMEKEIASQQKRHSAVGLISFDEASFTALMAGARSPVDFLITVNGIFSDGADYYYDMQLLRHEGQLAVRKELYQQIEAIRAHKKPKGMLSVDLGRSYQKSVIAFEYADALKELKTPLFAIFSSNTGSWHNRMEYATNLQIEMARNDNDAYRTWIVPDFLPRAGRVQLLEATMIYEFIRQHDNSFTPRLMGIFNDILDD